MRDEATAQKGEARVQQTIQETYSNSEVVTQIIQLRISINLHSKTTLGHEVFEPSEELMLQSRTASGRAEFIENMINLRDPIKNFNEQITNVTYTLERMRVSIPGAENVDGSFNKFIVFIKERKILIDEALITHVNLNELLNKVAHPNQMADFIKALKKLSLCEIYQSENWAKLHNSVLCVYRDFLSKLEAALERN